MTHNVLGWYIALYTMKYDSGDDAHLISQIANGQESAVETLYDRYNRLVFSVALVRACLLTKPFLKSMSALPLDDGQPAPTKGASPHE